MRKTFIQCGILGWGMEILWTGLDSFRRRDFKLTGHSSLWMFPIYGCAAFIGLKKKNWCPWDYGDAPLNIHGVIRLDYAPLWLLAGLFFEHVQNSTKKGGSLRPSGSAT